MTAAEWSNDRSYAEIYKAVVSRFSLRKIRLFAHVCIYQYRTKLDRRVSKMFDQIEKLADQPLSKKDLKNLAYKIENLTIDLSSWFSSGSRDSQEESERTMARIIRQSIDSLTSDNFSAGSPQVLDNVLCIYDFFHERSEGARQYWYFPSKWNQLAILPFIREFSTNPFVETVFEPGWRSCHVMELANAIYEEKAFDRMSILADALMDAGCNREEILEHCKSPTPHVRGCWLLDLILEKV